MGSLFDLAGVPRNALNPHALPGAPAAPATLLGNALVPAALPDVLPANQGLLWRFVSRRFSLLSRNITITPAQRQDGEAKQANVRNALNRHYWSVQSETANSLL